MLQKCTIILTKLVMPLQEIILDSSVIGLRVDSDQAGHLINNGLESYIKTSIIHNDYSTYTSYNDNRSISNYQIYDIPSTSCYSGAFQSLIDSCWSSLNSVRQEVFVSTNSKFTMTVNGISLDQINRGLIEICDEEGNWQPDEETTLSLKKVVFPIEVDFQNLKNLSNIYLDSEDKKIFEDNILNKFSEIDKDVVMFI